MHHRIEAYRFGMISVDEFTHENDLIVLPESVVENWHRKKGHHLVAADLQPYLDSEDIQELIVGTGKFGGMKIDDDVLVYLDKHAIVMHALPTTEAVELYNKKELQNINVAGAFHLTC
ncbi:hypothetical protein HQ585_01415 [candidate division KSB1 bacterium]|nr:hypothetical protein [candidate division KSB1 bacterium]